MSPDLACRTRVPAGWRIGDVARMQQPGDARPFGGPLARPPAVSAGRSRVREAPGGGVGSGLSRYRGRGTAAGLEAGVKVSGRAGCGSWGCRGDAPERRRAAGEWFPGRGN